jgi:hypothetical protein
MKEAGAEDGGDDATRAERAERVEGGGNVRGSRERMENAVSSGRNRAAAAGGITATTAGNKGDVGVER